MAESQTYLVVQFCPDIGVSSSMFNDIVTSVLMKSSILSRCLFPNSRRTGKAEAVRTFWLIKILDRSPMKYTVVAEYQECANTFVIDAQILNVSNEDRNRILP
jgi:hypothetical protein